MPEDDPRLAAAEAARASAEAAAAAARADAEGVRRELDTAAERELRERQGAEQTAAALRAQLTQVEEAARRHAVAAAAAGDATTKEHHTNLRAAQYIQVRDHTGTDWCSPRTQESHPLCLWPRACHRRRLLVPLPLWLRALLHPQRRRRPLLVQDMSFESHACDTARLVGSSRIDRPPSACVCGGRGGFQAAQLAARAEAATTVAEAEAAHTAARQEDARNRRVLEERLRAAEQALTAQGHAAHYAAVERSTTEQLRAELAAARKRLVEAARYQVRAERLSRK